MARNSGTDKNGASFSNEAKLAVWKKGQEIPGKDKNKQRMDICGAVIEWDSYGDTTKDGTGWESIISNL